MKTVRPSASTLSWFATPPPSVAVEIAPRRVTAVAITSKGRAVSVSRYASEALPEQALTPALNAVNIADRPAVVEAIKRAIAALGMRVRRVALVIPDPVAKVSIVRFEKAPPKAADLDQLIRWQVRKAAPFRIEDAQLTFAPGAAIEGGGREYAVILARRDIVEEYELVCGAAGLTAGLVDLSSFNLINLVLANQARQPADSASPPADWLLVNLTADYTTIAIVRGEHIVFHRNRRTADETDLADMVHQTAMYYEDRLGGVGFGHVVLAGAAAGGAAGLGEAETIRRTIEQRLQTRVQAIDPRPAAPLTDRINASPELLDALAAPLGALMRERVA